MTKLPIEEMRQIAKERDGKCLSLDYIDSSTKLFWECKKGHKWRATPRNIKRGRWCPTCGGSKKSSIEEMQKLATERGGVCLSKEYSNSKTHLLWECEKGHRWKAIPTNINRGKWCPFCAGSIKLTLRDMQKLARNFGGRCLSKQYINARTKLSWECSEGHQWKAYPYSVKSGQWCPKCGRKSAADLLRHTIEDMKKVAKERGGRCLSDNYVNARRKLMWECAEGHHWETTPSSILAGRWCHECSTGLGERICREFFEQLFENQFPKSFPKWLINESGNKMELDGYCEKLQLAFEHQGEQHYTTRTPYIKTEIQLKQRKEDDLRKKRLCKANGIKLIEVPEIPNLLKISEVKSFIKEKCNRLKINIPSGFDEKLISLKKAYSPSFLNELRGIAITNRGKCHAREFRGWKEKVEWECAKGHRWKARPDHVKRGHWCNKCSVEKVSNAQRLTLDEMQKIAYQRGGNCLSKYYINSHTNIEWQCSAGHKWKATPSSIKSGSWCKKCAGLEIDTIKNMRSIAKQKGGKCISNQYINAKTKLLWECSEGHQWFAAPDKIKRGRWCPKCNRIKSGSSQRLTIEEMQALAVKRGGQCLSSKYKNNRTKLLWECKKGHKWEARPSDVKIGTWCPECYKLQRRKSS